MLFRKRGGLLSGSLKERKIDHHTSLFVSNKSCSGPPHNILCWTPKFWSDLKFYSCVLLSLMITRCTLTNYYLSSYLGCKAIMVLLEGVTGAPQRAFLLFLQLLERPRCELCFFTRTHCTFLTDTYRKRARGWENNHSLHEELLNLLEKLF